MLHWRLISQVGWEPSRSPSLSRASDALIDLSLDSESFGDEFLLKVYEHFAGAKQKKEKKFKRWGRNLHLRGSLYEENIFSGGFVYV